MNQLTRRAVNTYNALNDVHRKENYAIAVICGVIIGVMLALAV